MKKYISFVLVAIVLFLGVASFGLDKVKSVLAGTYVRGTTSHISIAGSGSSLVVGVPQATSTGVYLTSAGAATASSTLLGTMNRGDQIDLDVFAVGSTSTSNLVFSVYVSNTPNYDCTATPTACDWFNVDQLASADTSAHISKDIINTLNLGTTTGNVGNAIKRHFIVAEGVMAKYYKINFGSTVAPAFLWAQATVKESTNQ